MPRSLFVSGLSLLAGLAVLSGCGGDGGNTPYYPGGPNYGDWTFTMIPASGFDLGAYSVAITRNDRAVGSRPTDECRVGPGTEFEPSAGWCQIDVVNGQLLFRVENTNQPYRIWVRTTNGLDIPFTRVDLERDRDGAGQTVEVTSRSVYDTVWRVFEDEAELINGTVVDERSVQNRPKLPFTRK